MTNASTDYQYLARSSCAFTMLGPVERDVAAGTPLQVDIPIQHCHGHWHIEVTYAATPSIWPMPLPARHALLVGKASIDVP